MLLLMVIRLVRYFALLGAILGAVRIWIYPDWPLALRIPAGIVLALAGIVLAFALAIWAGRLAYEYAPTNRSLRHTLVTGKMGPPDPPHERLSARAAPSPASEGQGDEAVEEVSGGGDGGRVEPVQVVRGDVQHPAHLDTEGSRVEAVPVDENEPGGGAGPRLGVHPARPERADRRVSSPDHRRPPSAE